MEKIKDRFLKKIDNVDKLLIRQRKKVDINFQSGMKWDITTDLVDIKSIIRKYNNTDTKLTNGLISQKSSNTKDNLYSSVNREIDFLILKHLKKNQMFSVENSTKHLQNEF